LLLRLQENREPGCTRSVISSIDRYRFWLGCTYLNKIDGDGNPWLARSCFDLDSVRPNYQGSRLFSFRETLLVHIKLA
jgi:hypothetical protein